MTRLPGLDALRGIAALVVVSFHADLIYGQPLLFPKGYLAVDFFFVLSGYVMARSYEDRLRQGWPALRFVRARLWRLWPPMIVGGLLAFPLLYDRLGSGAVLIAALNLAFIATPMGAHLFPLNGPYWSLFYELAANLAHAAGLWRLGDRALTIAIVGLVAAMAALGLYYHGLSLGTRDTTFFAGFVRVALGYGLGVLLYRKWRDRPPVRVPNAAALLLLPLALLAIGRGVLAGWPLDLLFTLAVVPLAIAGGLRVRGGQWLGTLSFPLYVVHLPVMEYAQRADLPQPVAMLAAVLVAILVVFGFEAVRFGRKPRRPAAA